MIALLEADGLSAGYGKVEIVRDLDLHVDAGEVVALLGPNGAGKTTTISTLSGELRPLGGDIRFLGARTEARTAAGAQATAANDLILFF